MNFTSLPKAVWSEISDGATLATYGIHPGDGLGYSYYVEYPNGCTISIIKYSGSYGGKHDLWEVLVGFDSFRGDRETDAYQELCDWLDNWYYDEETQELIENDNRRNTLFDDCVGYLSWSDVETICKSLREV